MSVPAISNKIENVLIQGDLKGLTPDERVQYYKRVCESAGLNPLTKPFDYMVLNNKLTLYAKRDCTDQLRKIHKVSIEITARERIGEVYVVTAKAQTPDGRCDEATGAVALGTAKGDALANLYMKAETKAKRRVTLSICGLGLLDETEVESIPRTVSPELAEKAQARITKKAPKPTPAPAPETIDMETGEVIENESAGQKVVEVFVSPSQNEFRKQIKSLGFRWNPARKVWFKAFDEAEAQSYDFEFSINVWEAGQ